MGVRDDQVVRDDETRAFLLLTAAEGHDLHGRGPGYLHRCLHLTARGVGDRAGELDESVGDELQALVAQEPLDRRQRRRDRRHDARDGPDDPRTFDLIGNQRELAVHQDRGHDPQDDEQATDRNDGATRGVNRAEARPPQASPQPRSHVPAGGGEHRGGHEQEQEGDEGLGVLAAHVGTDEQDQDDPDGQTAQRPPVREDLHSRSQPQPTDRGREDDHDQDVVESVHVRGRSDPDRRGGTAGCKWCLAVPALHRSVHRLG